MYMCTCTMSYSYTQNLTKNPDGSVGRENIGKPRVTVKSHCWRRAKIQVPCQSLCSRHNSERPSDSRVNGTGNNDSHSVQGRSSLPWLHMFEHSKDLVRREETVWTQIRRRLSRVQQRQVQLVVGRMESQRNEKTKPHPEIPDFHPRSHWLPNSTGTHTNTHTHTH